MRPLNKLFAFLHTHIIAVGAIAVFLATEALTGHSWAPPVVATITALAIFVATNVGKITIDIFTLDQLNEQSSICGVTGFTVIGKLIWDTDRDMAVIEWRNPDDGGPLSHRALVEFPVGEVPRPGRYQLENGALVALG